MLLNLQGYSPDFFMQLKQIFASSNKRNSDFSLPEDSFPFCWSCNMPTVIRTTITRNTGILQEPATEAERQQCWDFFFT